MLAREVPLREPYGAEGEGRGHFHEPIDRGDQLERTAADVGDDRTRILQAEVVRDRAP